MPEFEFKAVDGKGKFVNGVSSAQDQASLSRILQDQGLFLMETVELGGEQAPAQASAFMTRLRGYLPKPKVSVKDVSFFTSQLSIMIRSALPILESLQILGEQTPNPTFQALVEDVSKHVSEGMPLSAAFARHPETFDQIYISLLAAGEAAGSMEVMLDRLSAYLDFKVRLEQKIRSALVYPVIVMLVAGSVIGFLVTFVLPTFADVFVQLNIDLPWPTRVLLTSGAFVRQWWWALLLAAGAAAGGARAWAKHPGNAMRVDRLLLRLPLIGELTRNIVLTRVLRTLGSLLESGVSILNSLELTKNAADNAVFRELLDKVSVDVKGGKVLSASLARGGELIPRVVLGMVATGERTGALPEIISRVAGFYEAETDSAVKNIFAAMEPLFIVVLGLMVGGIAISVLLPMFDMAQGIK